MSSHPYWTLIPFLAFVAVMAMFEYRSRRRRQKIILQEESYLAPVVRATNGMYRRIYGQPAPELEHAFPDILRK